MAIPILVTDKVIKMPKIPFVVQTENMAEEFEFQITESYLDISALDFFLKYRNSQNRSELVALEKKPVVSGEPIKVVWVPDANFTSVKGHTDIQLMAKNSATNNVVWNSTHAVVFLFEDVLGNSSGPVNPTTPALFLQYLEKIQKEVQKVENMSVSAESLEPTEEATVQKSTDPSGNVHLHFGIPKGESGGGGSSSWSSISGKPFSSIKENGGLKVDSDKLEADIVTEWGTSQDNAHIPGAKLVKDSFDLIKFKISVVDDTLKIDAPASYVTGDTLYIGNLA